jgi:hypothetical protein
MFCSVGTENWINDHEQVKSAVQILVLAMPLALFIGIRLGRRKKKVS